MRLGRNAMNADVPLDPDVYLATTPAGPRNRPSSSRSRARSQVSDGVDAPLPTASRCARKQTHAECVQENAACGMFRLRTAGTVFVACACNRVFEILRSMMFRPRNGDGANGTPIRVSAAPGTRGTTSPGSSTRTSWHGSAARSTSAMPDGRRPSLRSGCSRSPDAAGAKCSICPGATSGPAS